MLENLINFVKSRATGRSTRHRAEQIGRKARRSTLQRSLKLETLENRRVFAVAVLNEVVSDPAGGDQPFEYVEIKGAPGATLPTGLYFVSIEGDSAAQGIADVVVDLGGQVLGSNGLLVIKSDIGTGHTIPAATTIVVNGSFNPSPAQTIENGTNSFALILSPTTPIAGDLDTNTDGILELPVDASIIDIVGWSDGGANDLVYGSAALTQVAGSPPGAATRFLHDNRPDTAAAWYSGDLAGTNSSTTYSAVAANLSANFPVGGQITPGDINVPGDANIAPVSVADAYQVAPGGTLSVNAGGGVLSNDSDPNGVNSVLAAVLVTPPANATSFTLNSDGSFSYVNNGTPGIDTFTYQATDFNLLSTTTTVSINAAVSTNVAPVLTAPAGPIAYAEDGPVIVIAGTATISDSDSSDFASGSLVANISANAEPNDLLEVRNEGSGGGQIGVVGNSVQFGGVTIGVVTGGDGSNPLAIDLNANATSAATQALMRNITYRTLSDTPSSLARTVRFVVTDGDGGPALGVSNEVFTAINVTPTNDAPGLVASRSSLTYAAGGSSVTIDGSLVATDPDSLNFDAGVLTAAISVGSVAGDVLAVRNVGSGAGQIGVAGNVVSYEGTPVGTFAGGTGGVALTVTFNASATLNAVRATAQSIAFSTTSPRLTPAPRTISISITDGDGGTSNVPQYTVLQSQARRFGFQEGVDNGQGLYTGAADVQLAENQPTTHLPAGNLPLTEGLLVDFDGGFANSQVLMRFDNIFGAAEGQIPLGASIVSARLVVTTKNGGDGATLHRMLTNWDANSETWNSLGNGVAPRNATPAVQNDDIEARVAFDSQIGNAAGNSDPAANPTIIGVTADVQAWASGASNFGWLMQGWEARPDGWGFLASETANPAERPKLEIEWLPASITSTSFREGVGGYTGNVDTALTEATPTVNNSAATTMNVDFNDVGATNNGQVLMRFDNITGASVGQIPAGALVHSAALMLSNTTGNAQGDGGQFHTLLQPFDAATVTWDTFGVGLPQNGGGVNADGIEASVVANTVAGNASRTPNAEAGFNAFDVTKDVQAWSNGSLANNGWAILPWENGSDGWIIESSESLDAKNRPQLRVFFTPVGVTVTPVSGLTTSEAGGSANFSIVLNTPPTADVTIGLTSSDTTEGALSTSSVTFTPANWDIPQVVTVNGVDDLAADGNVAYQIVTAAAVSTDPNYNGLDVADVSLTNIDNESGGVAPKVETVVFGNGTNQRSMITSIKVNFDSDVTLDPNAFLLEVSSINGGGAFAPVPFTVNQSLPVLVAGKSEVTLTFSGAGISGGSLADGNYRLTALSSKIRSTVGSIALDGDNNGSAGGDFIEGESPTDNFFRLFGDSDGNGVMNPVETNRFRATVGRSVGDPAFNALFDVDGNGSITPADTNQFRQRVGKTRAF
jgi:hypothetical protein